MLWKKQSQEKEQALNSLAQLQISPPVQTHIPTRLPYRIHHFRLVHHVPLSERDLLFEVIREEFAADIYPIRSAQFSRLWQFSVDQPIPSTAPR